jgi:hypothetical protein
MPAQAGRSRNYAATCKPPECGSSLPLSLPEARFGNTNARPGRQIEKLCRDMIGDSRSFRKQLYFFTIRFRDSIFCDSGLDVNCRSFANEFL